MSDSVLLSAAFSMLETAVAVSRRGKIVYMNPAAVGLAGADLTSKPVDMLMPSHISNNQADSFVTTALIGEKKLHGESKLGKRIPHPRHKLRRFPLIAQRQRF